MILKMKMEDKTMAKKKYDAFISGLEKKREQALQKAEALTKQIDAAKKNQVEEFCSMLIPRLEENKITISDETVKKVVDLLAISSYCEEINIKLSKDLIDKHFSPNMLGNVQLNKEEKTETIEEREKALKEELMNKYNQPSHDIHLSGISN